MRRGDPVLGVRLGSLGSRPGERLAQLAGAGPQAAVLYRAVVAAPPPGSRKKAGKLLFPRSDIDLWVDLTDKNVPSADLLDMLVPASHAAAP